ncbi:946_t:CDS:2 [Acaulospora colombiana]|uniref:946_t:CDS:1 n=1 Tax=Acaulospora colombiana TaxID=27376 RepID=A0ACA9K7X2_9GLOM|nr:946_t:CDS:2 [Acaulospora colombiana]
MRCRNRKQIIYQHIRFPNLCFTAKEVCAYVSDNSALTWSTAFLSVLELDGDYTLHEAE